MREDVRMRLRHMLLFGLIALAACRSREPVESPSVELSPPAQPVSITTAEGLVIRDLVVGNGEPCSAGATVTINFTAALAGGEVYDSSERRKRPLTFSLARSGAIRGLREGIPGMRLGGKRSLHIPWSMAYGEHGREPIPPKTDLEFEIELIGIDTAR